MSKRNKKFIINGIFLIILITAIIIAYQSFDLVDFGFALKWYCLILLFTVVGFPISTIIFREFNDKGYFFAKVIGFLLPGYLMWLLSSLHILKFNYLNSCICLIVVAVISYTVLIINLIRKKQMNNFVNDLKDKISFFYRLEICFLILFLIVCYVKAFNPDANSTEKYMDYGFMAIINNSDYLPAKDLWLANEKINYYYFGHYICTFLMKLSRIDVNYGYNLSLTTLFTVVCFLAYSIGSNLLNSVCSEKNKYLPYIGGILGSLAINFAGNFHYVIFNFIKPAIETIFHLSSDYSYSFYDSTRYIGYNPDTIDKTIHEFPSFSFVLGDLHSHVVNMFFVFLLLGILLAYLLSNKKIIDKVNDGKFEYKKTASIKYIFNCTNIFIGFLLGIFKMTNYWDFPIYFVVVMLVFFISDIVIYKSLKDVFLMNIFRLIIFISISSLISLPFTLTFVKIASKIALVPFRTRFYQLLVLWGLPVFMILYYLITKIIDYLPQKNKKHFLIGFIEKLNPSDLFVLIIGFCGIGLIIAPEIIYVVDIYYDSFPRFNTMFKFTYQSFIMFGICYSYILIKLYNERNNLSHKIAIILITLFLLTCCYSYTAVEEWFGDISNNDNYMTLDARQFLEREYLNYNHMTTLDNLEIINYLNNYADKDAVILEAIGDSFSSDNQISTFTGRATILGWNSHEWLWRSKNSSFDYPEIVLEHEEDVNTLYHDRDRDILIDLINKYNISYIVIGYTERIKYSNKDFLLENEDIILELGDVVVESNNNHAKEPTYLIKINDELKYI